jgi:hypothetical protein
MIMNIEYMDPMATGIGGVLVVPKDKFNVLIMGTRNGRVQEGN